MSLVIDTRREEMNETALETSKYQIRSSSQGLVIGDQARFEQHIHVTAPPPPSIARDELLVAIRQASAELRAYPQKIADIHIERAEVTKTVEWTLDADPKERLGMLQDQPGGGKTVVMRDVLERLESEGVPVLAIKADTLSSVKTREDLSGRLGLPASVEECAHSLASEGQFIVLMDQLDALSLALSRDQATIDVMLDTLARLRDVEDMRIVASCRTFELNNDPRLSTIKVDRKFELQPIAESEINRVLQVIGVDATRLLPAHQTLLATPLHLKVYAQVVAGDASRHFPESFHTLQELYEALWQRRICAVPPDTPPPPERIAAVYLLVDAMQNRHQLTAPAAVLDEYPKAADYLEREWFIRREGSNWLFSHQTLFDYCYARRFVAQGRSLSQEILSGPQGLFERSQMIQVLAYLRGADNAAYRQELIALLFANDLRTHLRLLLVGWFGSLPNPTVDELGIARRLMSDTSDKARFLRAAGGNGGWFDRLNDDALPTLLRSDDDAVVETAANYLSTLIQDRTGAVLAHLRRYLGASETWDNRVTRYLSRLENWQNDEAVDMLCNLFQRGRAGGWGDHCLYQLAHSNPAAGCRALRVYLDCRFDDLLAQEQAESQAAEPDPLAPYRITLPDRFKWNQQLLGEYAIGEVMKQAVQVCPEAVVEHLLSWFLRAVVVLTEPRERDDYYPSDSLFAWGWYDKHISKGADFARRMAEALGHLAQTKPPDFRAAAAELASVESLAAQRVLAQAYLSDSKTYADDIFEYLIADPRRLDIGESIGGSPRYDSCRLYGVAFRYVDASRRDVLEQLVLNLRPDWEQRNLRGRGITQLRFLKSVPPDLLSGPARDRLGELERKFPGFELLPPVGIQFVRVGPPIEATAQARMSDASWLGAMRKYDDSTTWGDPREEVLKGGIVELSRSFAEHVKENPQRFYELAQRFDETISPLYIVAAISGLADSDAPAELIFDTVRRFAAPRIGTRDRIGVCRALTKRAEVGVPDDLLDLMTGWALNDSDPTDGIWPPIVSSDDERPRPPEGPLNRGINSTRGVAVRSICICALSRSPTQVERAFRLLEQSAHDPSTAVRACVIDRLGPLLQEDAPRALTVFEQVLKGNPRLLQTERVHRFLYWTYHDHFHRTRSLIEALLVNQDDATRRAGAQLVCLAAFRYAEASELAEQALRGDPAMRRGAAQVYACNLEKRDSEDVCRKRLLQLMDDPDDQVRSHVGECFIYLRAEHLGRLRPFIERFLDSPALVGKAEHLVKYLAPLAADEPDLALMVTKRILDVMRSDVTSIHRGALVLERDLVRLPLTVYTHTYDSAEKVRAMDLFERLLLLESRTARQALMDWDRR